MSNNKIKTLCYNYDLPENIVYKNPIIAIDTEALGLNITRDRLCVVQIRADDIIYIVSFPQPIYNKSKNLVNLLKNNKILKIMHFARFDMLIIAKYLGVCMKNIACTRILSKITRTYTDKHGLKELARVYTNNELNKNEQTSYWGGDLTEKQIQYAANDVLYLFEIYDNLMQVAKKEKRDTIAKQAFEMLPHINYIELNNFNIQDIIMH